MPAEAITSAGRDENQRAGRSLFDGVAAGAPPLEVSIAGELEVHAELVVFVLWDLRWANGMALEKDVSPGLDDAAAGLLRWKQRDEFVVAQHGDSAGSGSGHILTMRLCRYERKRIAARFAYPNGGGGASLE